ncbi:MAG: two-component sensor histidine kinase [Armatimonadetes bacterium]|nr:two-component sensor histidine kinase [Armatimonadota bacterium]
MLVALLFARYALLVGRVAAIPLLPTFAWFVFEVNQKTREPWVPFFLLWFLGGLCYFVVRMRDRGLEYISWSATPHDAPLLVAWAARVPDRDVQLRWAIEAALEGLIVRMPGCVDNCPPEPLAQAVDLELLRASQAAEQAGEVLPPWVRYPGNPPWWGGWRQGFSEGWLHDEWFPFWLTLSEAERREYAARWEADEEWLEHLFKRRDV